MEDDRYTRITLRIPKDLHVALAAEADATSKSLNAEIVARLASSFADRQPPADEERVQDIAKEAAELILRRIELPPDTPFSSDPLALVRRMAAVLEVGRDKPRTPVRQPPKRATLRKHRRP